VNDVSLPSVVNRGTAEPDITGFFEFYCYDPEYYQIWESFAIDIEGDACCGGGFDVNVTTYFGNKYVVDGIGWMYQFDDSLADNIFGSLTDLNYEYGTSPTYTSTWVASATSTEDLEVATHKTAAAEGTLFQWAKTSASVEYTLGSAWTFTLGLAVDVYGWDEMSFDVGFEF
ncbi:MAG: hypothetical protein ACTSX3_04125, partial [Candidatus Thorarchaeota archaeon]